MIHDALFYEKHNNRVKCNLCPHHCIIDNESYGICNVRTNKDGILKTINYGEITAINKDPIEKKPLYHFKPSKYILSVGSFGCNFKCDFCQNYSISQCKAQSKYISPQDLVKIIEETKDNVGVAFTYNEPFVSYEYVYDTSKILKEKYPNLKIVIVTNGYIEKEPLEKLLPYVDAMNIDLKSFNDEYYKKICGGDLEPVKNTIKNAYKKCHVEITTLMVNGLNDDICEIEKIASFLGKLDKNIPLHLSRYFPSYHMDTPATQVDKIVEAKNAAKKYLNYVYIGNVAGVDNNTYCPRCGERLVQRDMYKTQIYIDKNICPNCGENIGIII